MIHLPASQATARPRVKEALGAVLKSDWAMGLLGLALVLVAGVRIQAQPLTLAEAIRLALERNPTIKVEAYAPEIARANVVAALGAFDPALGFSRSYSRSYASSSGDVVPLPTELVKTDNTSIAVTGLLPTGLQYTVGGSAENALGPFNGFANNYASFGGVNLTQPLLRGFGFGANLVNVRVARANRAISQWQYRQTLIDTVTNVIIAYSSLVLAHDELRIAISYRDLGSTEFTQNEESLKAGSMSQSDVTTARAQVALREEAILMGQNAVRSADNQLRELIGERSFPAGRPLLVVETPDSPEVTPDPSTDFQYALANRPDYQAARLGIVVDRANYLAARNGLLPQVNLVASYGYNGLAQTFAASRRMVATEDFPSSSIGLNVSIPFTNAQARGHARAARLQCEQAEADLKRLEADIAVSIADAAEAIDTAKKRVAADRAAYELQRQALADEVKKERAGQSSTLAVIQVQAYLIQAENSVAEAEDAERQAIAAYDHETSFALARYHIDAAAR